MHIGFLTSEYPHEKNKKRVGGIGTSIKNLVTQFMLAGNRITIFLYAQEHDASYIDGLLNVVYIKSSDAPFLKWYFERKKIEKIINTYVEKEDLSVVEAAEWSGITAFMDLKCKTLLRLHGSDTYFCHLENRKLKYKNFLLEKSALKSADAIVSVSRYTADMTQKLFGLTKKIDVIHNGIDMGLFPPLQENKSDLNTILYFGTLVRKKGVLEIPAIFTHVLEHNPKAKLLLIGNDAIDVQTKTSTWGLMQEKFDKKALERVDYLGPVPYEKMRENILKSTVCIFPSYAEAFPVSWMEAMACEKPVVTSDIGWAKELIKHGENGLCIFPKKHVEYAACINSVLDSTTYAKSLGKAARKCIEDSFDAKLIAEKNIHYYETMIEKSV